MKKLIVTLLLLGACGVAKADDTGNQILLSLLGHVNSITEFTSHGKTKVEVIDGLIQVGHYKGDYIFAIDGGFANSVAPDAQGRLATTWGAHAHVISTLAHLADVNPALIQAFDLLELTPRWSYDTDVHHGVFGVAFGARIPF